MAFLRCYHFHDVDINKRNLIALRNVELAPAKWKVDTTIVTFQKDPKRLFGFGFNVEFSQCHRILLHDPAVEQMNSSIRVTGITGVMGHHTNCGAFLMQLA